MSFPQQSQAEGARDDANAWPVYHQSHPAYEHPSHEAVPAHNEGRPLSSAQAYQLPTSELGHTQASAVSNEASQARPFQITPGGSPFASPSQAQRYSQASYGEPQRLQSPPPQLLSNGNGHVGFTSPASPPPSAQTAVEPARTTVNGSAKRDGTASVSRSSRTGTSKIIGEPDSLIRKPSRNSTFYIAVTTIEAAIVITLVILIFVRIVTEVDNFSQDLKTISVYLAVFVFGCVFQVIIAWDAIRLKNTLQLIGVLIFNVALTVTAALEIHQVEGALDAQDAKEGGFPCPNDPSQLCRTRAALFPRVETYLIVVTAVCGAAEFALIYLTAKLWREFGWVIYQKIGADLKIRNMFLWYQLFIVFLKFAFFFGVGFTVIYLILVAHTTDWEYALTIAAVPVAMVALFTAGFAVRREWLSLMAISLMLMAAGLVYFVYKLTQVWLPNTREEYTYVHTTITFISGFAILSLGLTLLIGIVCMFNFRKGLKQAHDSIGIFGGVRRRRERPATEANALDVENHQEPKEGALDGDSISPGYAPHSPSPPHQQPYPRYAQHPHSPVSTSRPTSHDYSGAAPTFPQMQQQFEQPPPTSPYMQAPQSRPTHSRVSLD